MAEHTDSRKKLGGRKVIMPTAVATQTVAGGGRNEAQAGSPTVWKLWRSAAPQGQQVVGIGSPHDGEGVGIVGGGNGDHGRQDFSLKTNGL